MSTSPAVQVIPKEPDFKFIEDGHKYLLDGVDIPSVSEVIRPCLNYANVPKANLEGAREFGIEVDLACQFYDENDLDESTLSDRVRKRLAGWLKFRKDFDFQPIQIARPNYHNIHGMVYGLIPDRFGTSKAGNLVVDIKNTAEIESHQALQLAGYHAYYSENSRHQVGRMIVQLRDDDYKVFDDKTRKDIFDRNDIKIFTALLAVCHWNRKNGIKRIETDDKRNRSTASSDAEGRETSG